MMVTWCDFKELKWTKCVKWHIWYPENCSAIQKQSNEIKLSEGRLKNLGSYFTLAEFLIIIINNTNIETTFANWNPLFCAANYLNQMHQQHTKETNKLGHIMAESKQKNYQKVSANI